jgi:hypothetical protein
MSVATPEVTEDLEQLFGEPPPKCEVITGGNHSFRNGGGEGIKCENDAAWIVTGKCGGCGNSIRRFICDDHQQKYRPWVFRCTPCHSRIDLTWSPI